MGAFLFNILVWHWSCGLDGLCIVYWWEPLFFFNILFWHWSCVLVGLDAVYSWEPWFCFYHSLLALELCTGWAWRCVLMGAFVFLTSPFGTEVVNWLGLTPHTNGSLCFFVNILCWHWCCVLVGLDAMGAFVLFNVLCCHWSSKFDWSWVLSSRAQFPFLKSIVKTSLL